ncbi:MAG: hypothetical protein F4Z28_17085 [Gammaproteobacteria bacterium]|nr:hypothetical protein [Gammaproteobacteria bacterium]
MSFANLPLLGVLAGIAGIAALLFLLQLLRIRHVEVAVPTTLFWREAAREAPVRVLRGVFRHPLAYLLVLAICTLLWLAFAGPEAHDDRTSAYRVLFLDGSAHTAGGDDFEQAVDKLKADLAGLSEGRREVIWGGARNIKLLKAGEDRLLLDRRLASLAPEAAPSALNDQLRLLSVPGVAPASLEFVVYGRAPAELAVVERLPTATRLSRAIDYPDGGSNHGVAALGVNPAASGRWDRVDLLIRVAGTPDAAIGDDITVEVAGAPLDDDRLERLGDGVAVVRDLAADGREVEVRLEAGDELALDNVARLTLPDRRVVRVALADDLDPAIRHAIEADPGLAITDENASVVIRAQGTAAFGDLPALEFAPAADQATAFEIDYTGNDSAELALRASVTALGLDQIDAAGLAAEAQRPVGVQLRQAELPGISVWEELLAHFNFTGSRSFPVFISRSVRWLAGEPAWHPYLAAGRPLPRATVWSLAAVVDPSLDALGADYVLGAAGTVSSSRGDEAVALLSDAVTERNTGTPLLASQAGGDFAGTGIVTWLILAALLLLGAEWYLYQRGLMP